jgi:hypothetical protein
MGSLTGMLTGAGAVFAAGAVVVVLHRYGDAILRWFASLRYTVQPREPHGYVPLMGGPDPAAPRLPMNAPDALPEPPPRLAGNPPPGEAGWPYVHLELSRDDDGGMHATVTCDGRSVAILAVDSAGSLAALETDDLLAELQRRGDLTGIMERLHWRMPTSDLLAEVSRRAGAG